MNKSAISLTTRVYFDKAMITLRRGFKLRENPLQLALKAQALFYETTCFNLVAVDRPV